MPEPIQTDLRNGVLHITIDRPEKKNALTTAMYAALADALHRGGEPAVRVALLSGSEGVFTAGNDLSDFASNPPDGENSPVFRFLSAAATFEKPLIAAVAGHAVGIGTTILLHCDLVYASHSARFALPFVNLGLCPEAGSSYLLPIIVGTKKASEWLLFGDSFGPEEALAAGLINEIVLEHALLEHATERAEILARKPPTSLRLTKQLLRAHHADKTHEVMRREADHFLIRLQSDEAGEALSAFFEKRKPDFSRFE